MYFINNCEEDQAVPPIFLSKNLLHFHQHLTLLSCRLIYWYDEEERIGSRSRKMDTESHALTQLLQRESRTEPVQNVHHSHLPPSHFPLAPLLSAQDEKVRTALREEFQSTEDSPETSRDLTENLQDQIEAEAEAEAVKLLDEEEADNNHPLGDEMLEMMATKGEAQIIKDLVLTDLQDLPTENLRDINFADTEAEAIVPQMQIDGDDPGTPNDQPLDAETDWLIDYEPIKMPLVAWEPFLQAPDQFQCLFDTDLDKIMHGTPPHPTRAILLHLSARASPPTSVCKGQPSTALFQ
ncbi:hypothetical protein AOLI_G00270020 [Acnodon oligacanthus]